LIHSFKLEDNDDFRLTAKDSEFTPPGGPLNLNAVPPTLGYRMSGRAAL